MNEDELRATIANLVYETVMDGEDYWTERPCHEAIADKVLAIPHIAAALKLKAEHDRLMLGHSIKVRD